MKTGALESLAPPAPDFGENLVAPVETIADVWGCLPPSDFAPDVLLTGRDISQHHYDLAVAEIDRLQTRIGELKIAVTRSF